MLVKSHKFGNSKVALLHKSNKNNDPFNVKGWNRKNFVRSMKKNGLPY